VREDAADDLDAELATITGPPIDVTLKGAGAFGEGEAINAVWAGVEENAALTQLAARCEAAARRAGLKGETRVYRPHVTLAYLNRPEPGRVAAWIQANNLLRSEPFRMAAFGLYSSTLGSQGSVYTLEREYRL
jgi:2'-5' RNA ligase